MIHPVVIVIISWTAYRVGQKIGPVLKVCNLILCNDDVERRSVSHVQPFIRSKTVLNIAIFNFFFA